MYSPNSIIWLMALLAVMSISAPAHSKFKDLGHHNRAALIDIDYGNPTPVACPKISKTTKGISGGYLSSLLEEVRRGCQKISFSCKEKPWHLSEKWEVVFDKRRASWDVAAQKNTAGTFTLVKKKGLLSNNKDYKYYRLDKMKPWVIIPIEKSEEIDRKLIIHDEKFTGAMVIIERVFNTKDGYQNQERKYYCKSSTTNF